MSSGILYVVATPIGNLADFSPRAISTLQNVDYIACEDTRHSATLLQNYLINTPTTALHNHNETSKAPYLIAQLHQGKNIALVSDAGTPLISDPGYTLVKLAHQHGIRVSPIPGACAAMSALSVAGLASDQFHFVGFLPAKSSARQKNLTALSQSTCTLILYEAPHRIVDCLQDIVAIMGGERTLTLCRELTKTFETIKQDTASNLLAWVSNDPNQQKGEIVLLIEGYTLPENSERQRISVELDTLLTTLAANLPLSQAASVAATLSGIKKNQLYQQLLAIK